MELSLINLISCDDIFAMFLTPIDYNSPLPFIGLLSVFVAIPSNRFARDPPFAYKPVDTNTPRFTLLSFIFNEVSAILDYLL